MRAGLPWLTWFGRGRGGVLGTSLYHIDVRWQTGRPSFVLTAGGECEMQREGQAASGNGAQPANAQRTASQTGLV